MTHSPMPWAIGFFFSAYKSLVLRKKLELPLEPKNCELTVIMQQLGAYLVVR